MTKEDLIAQISEDAGVTKTAASKVIDSLTSIIVDRAAHGDETTLHRFGTFAPKHRAARTGRNPQNGQPIKIDAVTVLSFRPSRSTKDQLN